MKANRLFCNFDAVHVALHSERVGPPDEDHECRTLPSPDIGPMPFRRVQQPLPLILAKDHPYLAKTTKYFVGKGCNGEQKLQSDIILKPVANMSRLN